MSTSAPLLGLSDISPRAVPVYGYTPLACQLAVQCAGFPAVSSIAAELISACRIGMPALRGARVDSAARRQRLRELGWIEGRTVRIEYRWAEEDSGRYAQIATEFPERKMVIKSYAGQRQPSFHRATHEI